MDEGPGKLEVADLLVEVNAHVRELAGSQTAGTEDWDFRCECGEPDCHEAVSLTVAEYELLRDSRSPILAEGHEPCRVRAAREAAHELRGEAMALREQARHQVERARRNLNPRDSR